MPCFYCFLTTLLYTAFPQRPNLPHPPSNERPRSPYLDKRLPIYPDKEKARLPYSPPENRSRPPHLEERRQGYSDTDRPRLPPPTSFDREKVPVMELDEKSRPSRNEKTNLAPAVPDEQPKRIPSPLDEEEADDYRILLQRHRLIQQQLAALENQENSSLGDDSIIDDTFIDIPVEDTQLENETNLQNVPDQLEQTNQLDNRTQDSLQSREDTNATYSETGNEIYDLDKRNETLDKEMTGETVAAKSFLPFKIKPRYSNVPSIKELSQKDLEKRKTNQQSSTVYESNGLENNQTLSQTNKSGSLPKAKRNRKKRKRKVSQNASRSNINNRPASATGLNQGSHVDPHNELEARLLYLSQEGSSVSVEPNRYDNLRLHIKQ